MGLSVWEILILLLIVVLIFGMGKLPQVMGDLGKSVRSFKAGWSEDDAPGATAGNDNAPTESWFHTLKSEQVHHRCYQTRQEAMLDIFECVEAFYNRQRRHSALGYMSPAQFAAAKQAA
ncbi:twin-arginine translocase TatA/TatE family subunit (plasmid) [Azospirillum argentinense]|uniref:Sec-independent protein translocase protein TatA n=1 Tax=Azospirillum brasilense TaxID=192 RepID=A0A4D8Q978_AZOBR|nr:twin-arginine translocase TatA/TatE family subunit [Azospirillum argentinense]